MTTIRVEIPWERYGTIAYLAENVGSLGKTALQKLVYFLQEWKDLPLGYRFEFYTYGPFSAALMGDLDYTDSLGAVRMQSVATGGYSIKRGAQNQDIQDRAGDFLLEHKAAIDEVISVFGKSSAVWLELLATTHYAYSYFASRHQPCGDNDIVDTVRSLKPDKFEESQIRKALQYLRDNGIVPV